MTQPRPLTGLAADHFRRAKMRLSARQIFVEISDQGKREMVAQFERALDVHGRILEGATLAPVLATLFSACASAELTPADVGARAQFAFALAGAWLNLRTHGLIGTDELRATVTHAMSVAPSDPASAESLTTEIATLLMPYIVDRTTGRAPGARDLDSTLPRVFIASPMTHASETQLQAYEPLIEEVQAELESQGYIVFAPAHLRSPLVDRAAANRAGLLEVDERHLSVSDVLVCVTHPPAHGVAYLVRMAVQFHVPVITLGTGELSTLLTDEVNQIIHRIPIESEISTALALSAFLAHNRPQLAGVRQRRAERLEQSIERVERFRRTLRDMSKYEWESLDRARWRVPDDRLLTLCDNPLLFVTAIGEERRALEYLDPAPSKLDQEQREALQLAQSRASWDEERSAILARYVQRMMSRAPSRSERVRFRTQTLQPAYWMGLDVSIG